MKDFLKKIGSRIIKANKVLFGLADIASEIAVVVNPRPETIAAKKAIDYIQSTTEKTQDSFCWDCKYFSNKEFAIDYYCEKFKISIHHHLYGPLRNVDCINSKSYENKHEGY